MGKKGVVWEKNVHSTVGNLLVDNFNTAAPVRFNCEQSDFYVVQQRIHCGTCIKYVKYLG